MYLNELSYLNLYLTKEFVFNFLDNNQVESLYCWLCFFKVKINIKNIQRGGIFKAFYSQSNSIKSLHSLYVKELYKDRVAPVIPFDRKLILDTCDDCLDKTKLSEFLKKWGLKSCIYLIEYKHDPLIYYIGRTNLLKRRIHNHLKADSGNKLHLFLSLAGWEHFNFSIIEECSPNEQGAKESYYLQKYLPLLNSVFSSSSTESAINLSLSNKLASLKTIKNNYISGQSVSIYVYNINDKIYVKYSSITKASINEKIARGTLAIFRDTNVPFRNKLYYTIPIKDFELTFNLTKSASSGLKFNQNIAKEVWVYNAETLELIKGSSFFSKIQASKALGISWGVIDYFLDTGKPEGVKGNYLYTRSLDKKEIEILLKASYSLQLGNKIKVWAYNAETLELINGSAFPSLFDAGNYFNVNYRTITRYLDTKLASMQNKTPVYFFKKS